MFCEIQGSTVYHKLKNVSFNLLVRVQSKLGGPGIGLQSNLIQRQSSDPFSSR